MARFARRAGRSDAQAAMAPLTSPPLSLRGPLLGVFAGSRPAFFALHRLPFDVRFISSSMTPSVATRSLLMRTHLATTYTLSLLHTSHLFFTRLAYHPLAFPNPLSPPSSITSPCTFPVLPPSSYPPLPPAPSRGSTPPTCTPSPPTFSIPSRYSLASSSSRYIRWCIIRPEVVCLVIGFGSF